MIYLFPILALIYYRAFIFTASFNQPIDKVIDDLSDSIGFVVPSYQLATNDDSLYNQYFKSSVASKEIEIEKDDASKNKYVTNYNDYSSRQPLPDQFNSEKQDIESQPDFVTEDEVLVGEVESALAVDEIVNAVKNTVSEALSDFIREEAQHDSANKSSLLDAQELLFKARLAYWNGDLKKSEIAYIQLTEVVSEDPNAYGELGNLYYMQSKWKKASDAYYNAALKLNKINNAYQAQHLLRIIRGLDTETADKLQLELNQTS